MPKLPSESEQKDFFIRLYRLAAVVGVKVNEKDDVSEKEGAHVEADSVRWYHELCNDFVSLFN